MQTHAKTNVMANHSSVSPTPLSLVVDNGSERTQNAKIVPIRNYSNNGVRRSAPKSTMIREISYKSKENERTLWIARHQARMNIWLLSHRASDLQADWFVKVYQSYKVKRISVATLERGC